MNIITDSREQKPYWKFEIIALLVGDYTTDKLIGRFHIERKSLIDLYGTITKDNTRFKAELFRAAYHGIKLSVYVEGTFEQFVTKDFPQGDRLLFPEEGLRKMVKTFERKYFVEFVWCGSRSKALKLVRSRLMQEEKARKR